MAANITQIPLSGTTYTLPTNAPTGSITINTIGGGGGGGNGYILQNNSINWAPPQTTINSLLSLKPGENGHAIIETNHNRIDLDDFYEQVYSTLCIIPEDKKLHNEHPTLADAYERYQSLRKKFEMNIDPDLREAYNEYQSLKAILTTK